MTMAERDTPKSSSQEPSGPNKEGSKLVSRIEPRPSTPPLRGIAASTPKAPLKPRVGQASEPPPAVRPAAEPPPLSIEVEIVAAPSPRVPSVAPGPVTPRRASTAPAVPRSPSIPPPASSRPRPALPSVAAGAPKDAAPRAAQAPAKPAGGAPSKAPSTKTEPPPRASLTPRASVAPRASLEKAIEQIPGPPPVPTLSSGPPPVPTVSSGAPPPPIAKAIAELHRKLDEATMPDGSTEEILAPVSSKPASGLAPGRAPSPMAVVVGSSLRIGDGSKPAKSSSPGRLQTPPSPFSVAPPAKPSAPPSSPSSPSSKSHAPRPAYDQAFRRWSQPDAAEVEPVPEGNAPVTYQVYTAKDISAGRGPMRSMAVIPDEPQKMGLGARIGIAAFGVLVALTVAAVVAVSTEDPKPTTPTVSSPRTRLVPSAEPTPPPPAIPAPTTMAIGDGPEDPLPEPAVVPSPAAAPSPAHVVKPAPTSKPPAASKPAGGSKPPATVAPPPNPYAN